MKKRLHFVSALVLALALSSFSFGQNATGTYRTDVEPNAFDYGRMWAFEFAPLDYFEKTYQFRPDAQWLEKSRLSALRFSSYCSASFISPQGLILTNHHCSRGEVGKVMKDGEDFDKNGFYASAQGEERRVPGLYVTQLVQIADVTSFVQEFAAKGSSDAERLALRDSALQTSIRRQATQPGWQGLQIQPVAYYNGGRYSLYGYKRYDDVRLVLIPELDLGAFGGDPDNFTYPRYSLDFTLWRVYENGRPVNSGNFYFPVNTNGIEDGQPVFTIGNPGRTERYRTVAQLEFDRDYRYKALVSWLRNRSKLLSEEFAKTGDRDIQEEIFSLENSIKAYGGIIEGMYDPYLMGKKAAMEKMIKAGYKGKTDYWSELASIFQNLRGGAPERVLLRPTPLNGDAWMMAFLLQNYKMMKQQQAPEAELEKVRTQIRSLAEELGDEKDVDYLAMLLSELQQFQDAGDNYLQALLNGKSPREAAERILDKTRLEKEKAIAKLLEKDPADWDREKDPLLELGRVLTPVFMKAQQEYQAVNNRIQTLEQEIAGELFNRYGLAIPPDATFTLRLSDGIVKSYPYNGTIAPIMTTYFGLYDRYYANKGEYPWSLPQRWLEPPRELLRTPLNFIAINDITGGSSGSPIINKNRELVGLAFDGNIESLPGNFIFDETLNRTVGVHAGGITAALRYIYKADRLIEELGVK